ncbi:hypothetical protein Q8F55_001086 [Vanrija albida]|uniref:Magnesium-dependent phosphatase-1 n=1 Tax=Vanrija albida TaxID=181172 RepID=A0ABR3QFK1_9TREE
MVRRPPQPSPEPAEWRTLSPDDPEAFPKAVVFDLDYTLWDLWIDTHISPPLRRRGEEVNALVDRRGSTLEFYPEVPGILAALKARGTTIGVASRTSAIDLAQEALSLLLVPGVDGAIVKARSFFDVIEIYPSSKIKHFHEIHKRTRIPYEQMLFFDDESRNHDTESLGVTMHLIRDGMNRAEWDKGLARWRKRRGIKVRGNDSN